MKATYIDHMGTDLSVVNAARVSFGKKSVLEPSNLTDPHHGGKIRPYYTLSEGDTKLINYLAKHGHHSPFNHTYLTFHMKAPIFVARQLVKHKFMPWNEISRRYVDDPPEFYWPDDWRGKAKDRKQGSSDEIIKEIYMENVKDGAFGRLKQLSSWVPWHLKAAVHVYDVLVKGGVAPEQARMVLPQNTYTEWYWSGTLHAWSEMYNLRSKEDTQQETRELITQIDPVMNDLFPVSWAALTKENP